MICRIKYVMSVISFGLFSLLPKVFNHSARTYHHVDDGKLPTPIHDDFGQGKMRHISNKSIKRSKKRTYVELYHIVFKTHH
jgi:hypothetical protein